MNQSSGDFYQGFDSVKKIILYFYIPNDLAAIVDELEIDAQLSALLVQAHRELGILEGMTKYMPSVASYENMLIYNEAQYSYEEDLFNAAAFALVNVNEGISGKYAEWLKEAINRLLGILYSQKNSISYLNTLQISMIFKPKQTFCNCYLFSLEK